MEPTVSTPQLDDSQTLALVVATIRDAAARRPEADHDPEAYERWTLTMAGAAHEVAGILRAGGRL